MAVSSIATLCTIFDDQLIKEHDEKAIYAEPGISYCLDELSRRKFER